MAIEVTIDPVRVAVLSLERTIILQQKGANNYLPLWVDESQADIIVEQLYETPNKDIKLDLFLANNNAPHADVKSAIIHLDGSTFYAKVLLSQNDREYEVKCPIGIAIALAVRAHAPVLVDEEVINEAGVCLPLTSSKPPRKKSLWRPTFKSHKQNAPRCSLKVAGYDGTDVVHHFLDDVKDSGLQGC